MAKRALDILLGSFVLLLASPIFLVVIAVLALTGEREVFYSQERVGRFGRTFRLLKFVTMIKGSSKMGTGTLTIPNDPRVLPVGKFLRKTKINELPQLWNVVRGDMSLVGPRPLACGDFDCYSEGIQRTVVKVRPGLTGVGSIFFRDEEERLARSELPPLDCYRYEIAPVKGALEAWYVENQDLVLDVKLLALTAVVVILPQSNLHERILDLPPNA